MQKVELSLLGIVDERRIELAIEDAIATSGLRISLRGTLQKYPGCAHWHVRSGRERGTLELTFWPAERRAWFTVQNGRTGDWIAGGMHRIRRAIGGRGEA